MNDIFNLEGKTALITGASSGLGKHFAKTLAGAGASVILSARRVENLEALKNEIGSQASCIPLDVTSAESIDNLIKEIRSTSGSLDILINNAGVSDPQRFKDLTEESWNYVLETNLNGAFRMAKAVTDIFLEDKKGGSIINIASILGIRVGLNLTSYAVAKAGLVQLTKSMALELARSNIRVNAIAPGTIEVPSYFEKDPSYNRELGNSLVPWGRVGLPEEVGYLAAYLVSDFSEFMLKFLSL